MDQKTPERKLSELLKFLAPRAHYAMALLELQGENYEEATKHLDEALLAPHDKYMLMRIYETKSLCCRLQGSGLPKALDL